MGLRPAARTRAASCATSTPRCAGTARSPSWAPRSTWCTRRPTCPATGWSWCPTLYLCSDATAAGAAPRTCAAGGHVLVTYFSGIVDEHDHVRLGGYPGAFRELLGVRVEEFAPLLPGATVTLDDGSTRRPVDRAPRRAATPRCSPATPTARCPGTPALTRRARRRRASPGTSPPGWTRTATAALADRLAREAGVTPAGRAAARRGGGAPRAVPVRAQPRRRCRPPCPRAAPTCSPASASTGEVRGRRAAPPLSSSRTRADARPPAPGADPRRGARRPAACACPSWSTGSASRT